ncbi:hypothetical protein [Bacillus massilinigeriensis]|uniref:hypothetical protein n=1 Tax=Bacillus mediterraneensis TaxID=1805474 RepID=UPI0008F7EF14|nr:hypothetical protein [Bacillus mediterraneensis]
MLGLTKRKELLEELSGIKTCSIRYLDKAELYQILEHIACHGYEQCKAGVTFGFITEWHEIQHGEFAFANVPDHTLMLSNYECKLGYWEGWECYDRAISFPNESKILIVLENHICSASGTSRLTLEITLPAPRVSYFLK